MKRVLFLWVMMLLLSFPIGMAQAAEIYWDGVPADEEITDDDFKYKYGEPKSVKSLGDLEVYDDNLVINVPGPDDPAEPDYESGAPIPPRAVSTPRATDVAPPQPRVAPRSTDTGRVRSTTIRPSQEKAPKPATKKLETQPGAGEQTISDEPSPPPEKKMKWGQVDVKPSEPKNKFQWGEKK
ncbi:MAG: hypothetical protein HY913_15070 [Desulfomonile tiedjei]|nr:hypothetical protein [Desulfomonile tiedjei]